MDIRKTLLVTLLYGALLAGCTTSTVAPEKKRDKTSQLAADAYFTNPIADGADPWVIKKDGFYYSCGSGRGGIYVSKSDRLTNLGERVIVWRPPATGWNQSNIWAPEIHFMNGHWYIYYAAAKQPGSPFIHQRSGVLESESEDPFGSYEDKGLLYTGDNIQDPTTVKWAIDLSPFRMNGQLYAVWSGWEENADTDKTKQHLYHQPKNGKLAASSI
jgi:GH43 family beta-xylosidase